MPDVQDPEEGNGRKVHPSIQESIVASTSTCPPSPKAALNMSTRDNHAPQVGFNSGTVNSHITHNHVSSDRPVEPASKYYEKLGPIVPQDHRQRILEAKGKLLPHSCEWVFEDPAYQQWISTKNQSAVMWLHGHPGKGKTMIISAALDQLHSQIKTHQTPALVASFFCQRQDSRLNNVVAVVKGLLCDLLQQYEELVLPILRSKSDFLVHSYLDSESFWSLRSTLQQVVTSLSGHVLYLVVDALDECEHGQEHLLNLLDEEDLAQNKNTRWLVSSRNEPQIQQRLLHASKVVHTSLEVHSNRVDLAVSRLIDERTAELRRFHSYPDDMYHAVRDYLSENAEGTFLWVSLVCAELKRTPRRRTVVQLSAFPSGLQELYSVMLSKVESLDDTADRDICLKLLRLVVIAERPLSLSDLRHLARVENEYQTDDVADLIDLCGAMCVVQDDHVSLVHQSSADFFKRGSGKRIFPKGLPGAHETLAHSCMQIMQGCLQRDICSSSSSSRPSSRYSDVTKEELALHISNPLRYACRYWHSHVQKAEVTLTSIGLLGFLKKHILHWLEVMAWLRHNFEAEVLLEDAASQAESEEAGETRAFITDALRLVERFQKLFEHMPLQLYYGVLVFIPSQSLVYQALKGECLCPELCHQFRPRDWEPDAWMREETANSIAGMLFSPNGSRLASASLDGTVQLWDTYSEVCTHRLDAAEKHWFWTAFSPDGSRLATYRDKLLLWDVQTGSLLLDLGSEHGSGVVNVSFSPDGSKLASTTPYEVHIWDSKTGYCLRIFNVEGDPIQAVFSPDGARLALASDEDVLQEWEVQTGKYLQTLEKKLLDTDSDCLVYSPDGRSLAALLNDYGTMAVGVWSMQTGKCIQILECFRRPHTLVFSPNSSRLAWKAFDLSVQMWDLRIGWLMGEIRDVFGRVSFDGKNNLCVDGRRIKYRDQLTPKVQYPVLKLRVEKPEMIGSGVENYPGWIFNSEGPWIRLPSNLPVSASASYGNCLALGLGSGEVKFMWIDQARDETSNRKADEEERTEESKRVRHEE